MPSRINVRQPVAQPDEEHGLRQRDLLDVFGSRGIASEVVSGKRAISKAQAKKLAEVFHVPADLFL